MVRRLVRKVISTCTKSRTSLLMRQLMSLRAASRRIHCRELATPPPADQTDNRSDTGPDPSLPTTGDGGVGAGMNVTMNSGGRGGQLRTGKNGPEKVTVWPRESEGRKEDRVK